MENFIDFTNSAIEFIKTSIDSEKCKGVRINVVPGGCQGMTYEVSFVNEIDPSDVLIQKDGVDVYVAAKAVIFVSGMTIDCSSSPMGKGLIFLNPNAKSKCGCGKSFCTEGSTPCGGKCGS